MTQIATVTRLVEMGKAEVLVCRQSACGHDCASCGGCGPENSTRVTAVAENEPGARPGDTVRVESASARVLGMASALYLLPLALLFAGYFLASGLLQQGEGISMVFGLLGFLLGIAVNVWIDRRLQKKAPIQFRITEVVRSCSDM